MEEGRCWSLTRFCFEAFTFLTLHKGPALLGIFADHISVVVKSKTQEKFKNEEYGTLQKCDNNLINCTFKQWTIATMY